MRPIPFAAIAAVVLAATGACSPRLAHAQEVPARWGAYTVEAVDASGRPLATFEHRGRTYVLGALGERYLLRFRNQSGRRVEVVASVDGRDVVDGRPASFERRGYIVAPYGEVTIDGFRVSQESVAAFRFSTVPRSYAARKGDARDVGVIGVAVFAERRPVYVPPPRYPYPAPYPGDSDARPDARSRSEAAPGPAEGSAPPPSAAPLGRGEASAAAPERAQRAPRPGLGTEFGEEHESRVETASFERASARPQAVLTLRYDDRAGLVALGIDVDGGRHARRDEAWRRETASPFRSEAAYCEPPPGWTAGVR